MPLSTGTQACVLINMLDLPPAVRAAALAAVQPVSGFLTLSAKDLQARIERGASLVNRLSVLRDSPEFKKELVAFQGSGFSVVTLFDDAYPALLKEIYFPPILLYFQGDIRCLHTFCVAMVGSRRASSYGLQVAEQFAYKFGLYAITVVSGFARGIDTAACNGTLHAQGKTAAVLGSGLLQVYPAENKKLIPVVCKQGGAIVSEYPLFTRPLPHNFPRRNRIISGLCKAVVVVEAAQKSGALITAACALEQNRDVFAIPGSITTPLSQGTHNLIKEGARLVSSPEEVLEELRYSFVGQAAAAEGGNANKLSGEEKIVYNMLVQEYSVEDLVMETGMDVRTVLQVLGTLKSKHVLEELPGKVFKRV